MIPLIRCAVAGAYDREICAKARLAEGTLMEIASLRLWDSLRAVLHECKPKTGHAGGPVLVAVCGSGNNAGDALAIIRNAVFAGYDNCAAILCRESPGTLASAHADSLRALGIPVLSWAIQNSDCVAVMTRAGAIVDGLAGTGLTGALRGSALDVARLMADLPAKTKSGPVIISVDLPSGLADGMLPDASIVRADWTLSLEPRKQALYLPASRGACGTIIAVDGVFPVDSRPEAMVRLLESCDLPGFLPGDSPWHYKVSRGRLAIFAGGEETTGAASLCARAGLSSGAGYIALFSEPNLTGILAARLEEIMVRAYPEPIDNFQTKNWDAVLAGPGWLENEINLERLRFLFGCGLPLVLDAGAIALYGKLCAQGLKPEVPVILTPHPGECARLGGRSSAELLADPAGILPELAAQLCAHIIFKSHVTWIVAPGGEIRIWDGLESGLGTAGSGDVLAGLTGGLLARHYASGKSTGTFIENADTEKRAKTEEDAPMRAACAAVLVHGEAGRSLRRKEGWFAAGRLTHETARILGAPFYGFDSEQQ